MKNYENLKYSIIVDGRETCETALLKDARFFAQTATLNATDCVEIVDISGENEKLIETFYPEEL